MVCLGRELKALSSVCRRTEFMLARGCSGPLRCLVVEGETCRHEEEDGA